jgi:two-component system, NarL family, sensor kinase
LPPIGDRTPSRLDATPATETERLVAWLRLPAIALIAAGHGLAHPNPNATAFFVAIVVFSAWSAGALAYVYLRPITFVLSVASTAVDVAAITTLAALSGGAFSQARLAYFLIPIAVAFRFRPSFTAIAAASTVVAYLAQALVHPASSRSEAGRFIAIHGGYLLWVGLAAVLLSFVLARRTDRIAELAAVRQRLMADALTAEERERGALAEGLHDRAIQNLLSVRHVLEEVGERAPDPALRGADDALAETVKDLREAIFELHPYVLEHAGLQAALPAIARRAAERGGFDVNFDLVYRDRHPHERLLAAVARELLANVAAHAAASDVTVRLNESKGDLVLVVSDNGNGFDPATVRERLTEGHIGLASQRARVESVGGRIEIRSSPGQGATVEVRLPSGPE